MNPKEKAMSLVEYFLVFKQPKLSDYSKIYQPTARMFAVKVCDEILNEVNNDTYRIGRNGLSSKEYWQEVKRIIEEEI